MPEYSMVVKVTQTGADQVTGKINALEKAMTLAREKAESLIKNLNALGSAANITFNLNTSNITSAESSVNDVTQAVEELNNRINQLNTERFQQLNANINTTSTNVNKASGGMGGLGKALGRIGGMVGSIFAIGQIASWGREAISTASDMERLKNMLTVMVGSADEAANAMGRIKQMEQGIASIDLKSGIESVTAFMRMGNTEEVAEGYTKALGKAVDYYGGTSQQVSLAIAQLEQLSGKTSGFGEDLRSLSNSLPGVKQMLTEAFGVSTVDEINELGVTGRQVVDTLIQKFNELPQVPVGIAGVFAQLKSRMTEVFTNIGNSLAPVIQKIAETFLPVIEKVGVQLGEWITKISEMPQFEEILNNIAEVLTNIAEMVMSVLGNPAVMELIMNTLNTASQILVMISQFFTDIVNKLMSQTELWSAINQLGNVLMNLTMVILETFINITTQLMSNEELWNAITTIITSSADILTTIVNMFAYGIAQLSKWGGLWQGISKVVAFVCQQIANIVEGISKALNWLTGGKFKMPSMEMGNMANSSRSLFEPRTSNTSNTSNTTATTNTVNALPVANQVATTNANNVATRSNPDLAGQIAVNNLKLQGLEYDAKILEAQNKLNKVLNDSKATEEEKILAQQEYAMTVNKINDEEQKKQAKVNEENLKNLQKAKDEELKVIENNLKERFKAETNANKEQIKNINNELKERTNFVSKVKSKIEELRKANQSEAEERYKSSINANGITAVGINHKVEDGGEGNYSQEEILNASNILKSEAMKEAQANNLIDSTLYGDSTKYMESKKSDLENRNKSLEEASKHTEEMAKTIQQMNYTLMNFFNLARQDMGVAY